MKTKLFLLVATLLVATVSHGQIGMGTLSPKAALDVSSTSSGVLIPRMNTATRNGLTVAADQNGMMVYDTDSKSFWYYDHTSTSWTEINGASSGKFVDGTNPTDAIFTGGNVGIGTNSPTGKFDVTDGYIRALDGANIPPTSGTGAELVGLMGNAYFLGYDRTNNNYITTFLEGSVISINNLSGGNVGIGTDSPTSKLQVVGLPIHANNAAALTAGLTAGAFYHNGDGIVRVVY